MNRSRKSLLRGPFVLGLAMLVGAGACAGGGGSTTIKIGLLTDETGQFKSFGTDIVTAVDLAVAEINASGGVKGAKLEVVKKDTSGDPQQAVVALRDLISADVFAIIGPISSSEAEVVFAQDATQEVPILTGTANKEGLTDLGKGWAFRDTATNMQLYSAAMPIYQNRYAVSHVAMIYDQRQGFAEAAARGAIPALAQQLGIAIDPELTIQTGQTDLTAVVQRVKDASGLDGLIVVTAPIEGGELARELSRQGVSLPVLGHPAQNSPAFRQAGADAVHDWVVPSVVNPTSTNEKAVSFAAAMKQRDREPPTVAEAANYYDIVYMLARVAGSVGLSPTSDPKEARKALRDGLASLDGFEGVAGSISFLPNGDVDRTVYTLLLDGTNPPSVLG